MTDPLTTAATRWPEGAALTDVTRSWTWSELLADATRLATSIGVLPGTRVGLLAGDRGATVVAIHAVRLAGAVLVPLHGRLAVPELMAQLTGSRTSVVLHDVSHADVARTLRAQAGLGRSLDITGTFEPADPDTMPVLDRGAAPGAIVHTSGTTAAPRAVLLSQDALLASAAAWNTFLESGPADHWLATLPLSHVAGLGMVLRPLLSGAHLTVHERFDPEAIRWALERTRVTLMSLVPTQLARLLDAGPIRADALRALLLGGGPIPPTLMRRALDAGMPVVATYGLTEAASGVTALPASEAAMAAGSAGRPLPGIRVRVVDVQDADVAPGVAGSILVAGPTLASGYDGDDPASNATSGDGWLRTRDVGTLDGAGRLWVIDRQDEMIISGGENVSPAEVESVLAMHPAVADAAVVGRPDPTWGAVPVAAITIRPGDLPPAVDELRAFARDRLASYKVPSQVMVLPAIPRTASGKVIRRRVSALIDALGATGAPTGHAAYDVPRPDGAQVHTEVRGAGSALLLLHATLSNARELRGLASELAHAFRVIAVDRRSAGASRMPSDDAGGAVDIGIHVEDLMGVLDVLATGQRVLVVGHSFGGCVALELAARHPERVAGVWAFEPPYLTALPRDDGSPDVRGLGDRIAGLSRDEGPTTAALAFLDAVRGPGTADRLSAAARERLGAEGRGAVADAALLGLDPGALDRISAPVVIGLGGRGRGPYDAVASVLSTLVPSLVVERFADLGHGAPVSRPGLVAPSILAFARSVGHVQPRPHVAGGPR